MRVKPYAFCFVEHANAMLCLKGKRGKIQSVVNAKNDIYKNCCYKIGSFGSAKF